MEREGHRELASGALACEAVQVNGLLKMLPRNWLKHAVLPAAERRAGAGAS